jgi:4'-phosphopantetheinyl transferase
VASSDLAVWMTRTELAREPRLRARCVDVLSDDERERWAAFHSDAAALDFLLGRALVRCALAHATGQRPEQWRFRTNAAGRPAIADATGPSFNLSHTPGLVCCVVASGCDVGIDVEAADRDLPIAELAERFFSARESAWIEAAAASERRTRFFQLFTLKEAYLKGRGAGIANRLQDVDVRIGERIEIEDRGASDAHRWQLWLRTPTPRHILAVGASIDRAMPVELDVREEFPWAA